MSSEANILITDDEESIRNALREILEFEGYGVLEAEHAERTFELLEREKVDLLLLDIKMKGTDGMEVLQRLNREGVEIPVIMISGHGTIEIAVEATKAGAFDFIEKPPDLNRLLVSVRNALDKHQLTRENRDMRSRLRQVPEILGKSDKMEEIRQVIGKVAPTRSRVMIVGENGTGKELVARWIHEKSRRSEGPFVAVNCAAIPEDLLESELFGHEEGAFTGATERRIGKFEQADGGTLFLDEVGDMSPGAQSKVLRALQENAITRVGGNETLEVDVRVLSATNKDLEEEIAGGAFREDLYHRLNVIPVRVPPLRERPEDIPVLARATLEELADEEIVFSGKEFTDEALEALEELPWSGNVRELQNAVERLGLLAEGGTIGRSDVESLRISKRSEEERIEAMADDHETFQQFKESAERAFLLRKLEENDWNVSRTAEAIDIQRSHIYNKMKKYDIER